VNEKIIEKLISYAIEQLKLAQWLTLRADLYSVEEDTGDNLTASSMYHWVATAAAVRNATGQASCEPTNHICIRKLYRDGGATFICTHGINFMFIITMATDDLTPASAAHLTLRTARVRRFNGMVLY